MIHSVVLRAAALICAALTMPGFAEVPGAGMHATNLRCDMRTNPIDVTSTAPHLSWELQSSVRGQRQTAYQVQAASSVDKLKQGQADLWDSGKRESDQSIHVAFGGKPLRSHQQVSWRVKAWDKDGKPGEWSEAASWTMALLKPEEWKAEWIGTGVAESTTSRLIEKAVWIWSAETTGTGKGVPSAPVDEIRLIQKRAKLPASPAIASAILVASADNHARVWINGKTVGDTGGWETATHFDVADQLQSGQDNLLQVAVKNGGNKPSPAGLVALLYVQLVDGQELSIQTDASWEVSKPLAGKELPGELPANLEFGAAQKLTHWGGRPWEEAVAGGDIGVRPVFQKEFKVTRPVKRALVHACGLGHHKVLLNGKPASDTFLDPAWSHYAKTCFYNTYDITKLVKKGDNAFGVMLANGFFNTAGDRRVNGNRRLEPLKMILQAHIEYEDGSEDVVATDATWKWKNGPYTHTSILGGVDYDARLVPEGFALPGKLDQTWKSASLAGGSKAVLKAAVAPPLRTFEQLEAESVTKPEPGRYVYDFGQNASATPLLTVKGPAGATVRMKYSEQRHGSKPAHNDGKGLADQSGIRSPNYLDYTLRGGEEEKWFPDFYYSGYQYIEMTGAVPSGFPNPENKPVVTDLKSIHVRANCEQVGTFECSEPMYNRIDKMVDWSVRSNLSHVLTDCPHREKMGWLEVIHLMWPSIASRFDLSQYGAKVALDCRDAQGRDGIIPTVAPPYPVFSGGFQYTPEWGASGTLIPWYTYQYYGDKRVLEENYACMRGFVDYMHKTSKDLVPLAGLGDWYDYGHGQDLGASRFTPTELTAMATFKACSDAVAAAANELGNDADASKYKDLSEDIRTAYNRNFATSETEYKNTGSPQTANAISLVTGMVDEAKQKAVAETIVEDMRKRGWMQTAGDVGFHYVVRALADLGRSDALFACLNREELGSYRYLVNAGWTALPESWNAFRHYSMNHCMLGHIQEWFSQDLVGIAPDPSGVAFKKFFLRPVIDGYVTSATGTLRTPFGLVACSWKRVGQKTQLEVEVPVNSEATLQLRGVAASQVSEGGKPVAGGSADAKRDRFEHRLEAGKYVFQIASSVK